MLKKILAFLTVFCLVFSLTACNGDDKTPDDAPTTTEQNTTAPATATIAPTFAAMPRKTQAFAQVYRLSDTVALFAFITPGMDTSLVELVCYDLSADTLLGEMNLGECWVDIFPQVGGFSLFDYNSKTYATYDTLCHQTSTFVLNFDGAIGGVVPNGDYLLLSDMLTGHYHVYDRNDNITTPVDETVGAADFTCVGQHKDAFLLHSHSEGIIAVSSDGKRQALNVAAASAQAVGNSYTAGVLGDYAVFYSLVGGDSVMCPVRGEAETFCAAEGSGYFSYSYGEKNALHYYDLSRRTVTDAPMTKSVVDAASYGNAAVAVLRSAEGEALSYTYVDFSTLTAESMDTAAYNKAVIEDRRPLPAISGVANEIFDLYGVTVIGDYNFFNMAPYGYTTTAATDDQIAGRTSLLKEVFAFFPEGVFRELSQKAPVVIVLCGDVGGTGGGLNALMDGYNVSFLSVVGNDEYFCSVAAHELGHALERGIALSDLDGWAKMQPTEVLAAYDNLNLTVEYTADDKGRTPVWFTDAYGRSSAMEDRATVFEEMYTVWSSGDASTLNYEGLRKKVEYWSYMLRNNFTCCQKVIFAWDNLFN